MEENVEVGRLLAQKCVHCTVEEMVDVYVASNSGHGTERRKGRVAVCSSRQLASPGVSVLTMVTVGFFKVCEIVLDWRGVGLGILLPMLGAMQRHYP